MKSTGVFSFQSHFYQDLYVCHFLHWEKKDIFHDEENLILKSSFKFLEVTEKKRINALYSSLCSNAGNKFSVEISDPTQTTIHFSQFSGGGDLYLTCEQLPPLVFLAPDDDENSGEGDSSTTDTDNFDPLISFSKFSPVNPGTSKLSALAIEGEKGDYSKSKLKYQLWANMVRITVDKFLDALLNDLTKQDILEVKMLVGYGMACGGSGLFGAYKLELIFGKPAVFITKEEVGFVDRLYAAGKMDFTLKYFLDNREAMNQ